uniref:Uncharacterized protein n=1 Tax=Timema poppense TaxID=170557 RepID=A0A7R9DFJ4_TIMPO|nr:unnamed protein product [Timema poppensis]
MRWTGSNKLKIGIGCNEVDWVELAQGPIGNPRGNPNPRNGPITPLAITLSQVDVSTQSASIIADPTQLPTRANLSPSPLGSLRLDLSSPSSDPSAAQCLKTQAGKRSAAKPPSGL